MSYPHYAMLTLNIAVKVRLLTLTSTWNWNLPILPNSKNKGSQTWMLCGLPSAVRRKSSRPVPATAQCLDSACWNWGPCWHPALLDLVPNLFPRNPLLGVCLSWPLPGFPRITLASVSLWVLPALCIPSENRAFHLHSTFNWATGLALLETAVSLVYSRVQQPL